MKRGSSRVSKGEPLLSLVSPEVLKHPQEVLDKLGQGPYGDVVGFCFRQIRQFQKGIKDFRLRYQDVEQMSALSKEVEEEVLDLIPAERRLKGISLKDLQSLPREELDRLLKLIEKSKSESKEK